TGFLAYHRLAFRQRLAFGTTSVTVPASRWSREEKEIAYQDVSSLNKATMNGQMFLYVTHLGGKYIINASMLSSKAVFAEVCELLATRVREAHSAEQRHT